MGIADVRRAFQEELGSQGQCTAARMTYDKVNKVQVFEFDVALAGGTSVRLDAHLEHGKNPVDQARDAAKAYGKTVAAGRSMDAAEIKKDGSDFVVKAKPTGTIKGVR